MKLFTAFEKPAPQAQTETTTGEKTLKPRAKGIYLSKETHARLKQQCELQHRKLEGVILTLLDHYEQDKQREPPAEVAQ